MTEQVRTIRDDCRRLAELLDEAENASGPWLLIPGVAARLHTALGVKLDGPAADVLTSQEREIVGAMRAFFSKYHVNGVLGWELVTIIDRLAPRVTP